MTKQYDITDKIERLEIMEEKCGISLEALYCTVQQYDNDHEFLGQVNGEVHAVTGTKIGERIEIVITVHDKAGRVVWITTRSLDTEVFFMFEPFSTGAFFTSEIPSKIRIYPKKY